jgi:hypothetical protein
VLRHNAVTLLLTVAVLAVTALNQFTTMARLAEFRSNNADLVAVVAESECKRADKIERAYIELRDNFVGLRAAYQEAGMEIYALRELLTVAGDHIQECHRLLEVNKITPPAFKECIGGPDAAPDAPKPI